MKILFATSEATPFAKTGGLADVSGSLPSALKGHGADVRVIMPLYKSVREKHGDKMKFLCSFTVKVSWREKYCGILTTEYNGVTFYFVDNEEYFGIDGYYGMLNDGERFTFFSKAVLDIIQHIDFEPHIIHCNEWQTGLVPVFLKTLYKGQAKYDRLKTVFAIHNIEYQGLYDKGCLNDLFGLDYCDMGILQMNDCINLMKGAIVTCDKLVTVSPNYAFEIQYEYYGKGLESIIKENTYKTKGILNGIDVSLHNPWFDKNLVQRYSHKSMNKKVINKLALQQELGLAQNAETPLIGMVTRLAEHKGIELVISVFDELMREDIQFVILGTGDKRYEDFFRQKEAEYSGKVTAYIGFSDRMASMVYAGADMFLMPSLSEPCGLSQMIALKYGTVPIVRATGGLYDSIKPYNSETNEGNGVSFGSINAQDMLGAIKRAIAMYWQKDVWKNIMDNCFKSDYSWNRGAEEYMKVYRQLV